MDQWEYQRISRYSTGTDGPVPGCIVLRALTFLQGIPFASAGRFKHLQLYAEQLGEFDGSNYGPIYPQKTTGSILSMNSSSSLILGETGTVISPVVSALADTVFNNIG